MNTHPRVERGVGILEHHLKIAARAPQRAATQVEDALAGELHGPAVGLLGTDHELAERRLAAARLADQAERLAGIDIQRDVRDGFHGVHLAPEDQPGRDRVLAHRPIDLEQWLPRGATVDSRACVGIVTERSTGPSTGCQQAKR